MPDMLTKYPDSAFKVLQAGGAKCGVADKPRILVHCPKEQFCTVPNGEICVYGLNQIANVTQFSAAEIAEITSSVPTIYSPWNILFLAAACLFGMVFGMISTKK